MHLAPVQAICRPVLLLPYRAHCGNEFLPFIDVRQLLELINADDDLDSFVFRHFSGRFRMLSALLLSGSNLRFSDTDVVGESLKEIVGEIDLIYFTKSPHRFSAVEETPSITALANAS